MFGSVNSLFSGLAFAGIIVTVWLQRNELVYQRTELRLQREELALTRTQMARSADAQEKAEEALSEQVKMLMLGSRLAAVEGLVSYYGTEVAGPGGGRHFNLERAQSFADRLEALLDAIEVRTIHDANESE